MLSVPVLTILTASLFVDMQEPAVLVLSITYSFYVVRLCTLFSIYEDGFSLARVDATILPGGL